MLQSRSRFAGAMVLVAWLGFAGAGQAEDLKIGLLLSQSGPIASYGGPMKAAAEYAAKAINDAGGINGKRVSLIVEDDASNPTTFLNGLNRLIDDEKVLAFVGPIVSGFFQAGAPIAQEKGVLMISPTATTPNLTAGNPMAFRNNPSEDDNIPKLLQLMRDRHPEIKTISVIYDNKQAADKIIGEIYQKLAPSVGWKVQEVVAFLSGQMNYSDVVAKTLKDKPDIVAAAAHAEDAANVARELRRQGYKGFILGGTPTVSQDYIRIADRTADETFVVVPYYYGAKTPQNEKFVAGYESFSGRKNPDPWEASTYECIGMIALAMKEAGVTGEAAKVARERKAVADKLAAINNYPGLVGPIGFDKDRVAKKPVVMIYVRDGNWHAL